MKKKLKGFTLVEILIVIVIIGILIGALVPRMQSAQGRARDVARKNDLSQIQSAIITSYSDRGKWPAIDKIQGGNDDQNAKNGLTVDKIESELLGAGLNGIPKDPISTNTVKLGDAEGSSPKAALTDGNYGYLVAKKNGVENAGFLLMAHTEVEGGANWIYCGTDHPATAGDGNTYTFNGDNTPEGTFKNGIIKNDDDLKNVIVCTDMTYHKGEKTMCGVKYDNDLYGNVCHYGDPSQLRYILTY